ncbi:hypothetical protein DFP72DRAFT_860233 [Ephemerocybe angulata]|uniref:Uncharacterized protein n=1 Tax=Ephemerocybe angulata TaxID=980116 RepID=A0A8H6LU18_9AGAR|nr:hypothetical protein DFP72DRAFT_860233 [Tulosesus angulatus]
MSTATALNRQYVKARRRIMVNIWKSASVMERADLESKNDDAPAQLKVLLSGRKWVAIAAEFAYDIERLVDKVPVRLSLGTPDSERMDNSTAVSVCYQPAVSVALVSGCYQADRSPGPLRVSPWGVHGFVDLFTQSNDATRTQIKATVNLTVLFKKKARRKTTSTFRPLVSYATFISLYLTTSMTFQATASSLFPMDRRSGGYIECMEACSEHDSTLVDCQDRDHKIREQALLADPCVLPVENHAKGGSCNDLVFCIPCDIGVKLDHRAPWMRINWDSHVLRTKHIENVKTYEALHGPLERVVKSAMPRYRAVWIRTVRDLGVNLNIFDYRGNRFNGKLVQEKVHFYTFTRLEIKMARIYLLKYNDGRWTGIGGFRLQFCLPRRESKDALNPINRVQRVLD